MPALQFKPAFWHQRPRAPLKITSPDVRRCVSGLALRRTPAATGVLIARKPKVIVFSVNQTMRDCIVAALRIHHDDPRTLGGLTAKIKREEIPAALAGLFDIWPADQDGT